MLSTQQGQEQLSVLADRKQIGWWQAESSGPARTAARHSPPRPSVCEALPRSVGVWRW